MANYLLSDLFEVNKEILANALSRYEIDCDYDDIVKKEVERYVKALTYHECMYIIEQYGFTDAMKSYLETYPVGDQLEKSLVTFLIWKEMVY